MPHTSRRSRRLAFRELDTRFVLTPDGVELIVGDVMDTHGALDTRTAWADAPSKRAIRRHTLRDLASVIPSAKQMPGKVDLALQTAMKNGHGPEERISTVMKSFGRKTRPNTWRGLLQNHHVREIVRGYTVREDPEREVNLDLILNEIAVENGRELRVDVNVDQLSAAAA